jgi:putative transposase
VSLRFLATDTSIYNTFYTACHMTSRRTLKTFRAAAHQVWSEETCA